jgi:hypothetical protein
MYGFLLRRLPAPVARALMVLWYLLLIVLVFRKFNMAQPEFRYIQL